MAISWGKLFQALPVLIVTAEQIFTDVKGAQKKANVLQLIGLSAADAAAGATASGILDPHQATIAQAVSGEIDNIVAGYNAAGWPGALLTGAVGVSQIFAPKPPTVTGGATAKVEYS